MRIEFYRLLSYPVLTPLLSFDAEKVYIVGGCVRDILMNRPLLDLDIVLERKSSSFINFLMYNFNVSKSTQSQFLTIKIDSGKLVIDVAQARREVYPSPGSLPRVSPCYDIIVDLKRRDFTINSMALAISPRTFELLDPLGGYEDLKKKVLRVNRVGSFADDPTRAFRAVKYKHRFGLSYDARTLEEFGNAEKHLKGISFNRIMKEIERICVEERRLIMFEEIGRRRLLYYWDESFDSVDYDLLKELDRILPRERSAWFYFLIPFGLEKYFRENKNLFRVHERKVLENLFEKKLQRCVSVGILHNFFKACDEYCVKVWAILSGVEPGLVEEYLLRREKIRPSISLRYLIGIVGDPGVARSYYEKIFVELLEGNIKPGEEKEYLKKIIS